MPRQETIATDFTANPARRFGTFLGVYTPSVLTILGVMMYLRFGWVVGNAGLGYALIIVLLASSITFITGLSASSISTNMRVGVGGEYYMVSRSLGLAFGGAIGIPLFLCRTLSLTLYAFGLAESVGFIWPEEWGEPPLQWIAAVTIILITAIAGKSAELSLKLQIPIMIAVGLSFLALAGGVLLGGFRTPEWEPHFYRSAPDGFWYVFAVFFPAVTGFTAGIGMSGDLKDPRHSIPRGTILAVLTGAAVYLSIMFLISVTAKVDGDHLAYLDPASPPVWTSIALLGFWLVYPGMWGAIVSSAFGSALGGPRVLQALARDGLAPSILSRTTRSGQPAVATWTTGGIALLAVSLGNLNAVGRWVTIFFLTLYVALNMAAGIETLVRDPSFRPTLRVPWLISFAGCAGALVVMFLISPLVCIVAVSLELALFLYLRGRALEASWGDVRAGVFNAVARFALLKLKTMKQTARNWRPHFLLFTANPAHRTGLVRMASWFNQNRGVVTVCQLIRGSLVDDDIDIDGKLKEMEDAIAEEGLTAFCEVDVVSDVGSGIIDVVQANGYAGMQSNTVMFGWPDQPEGLARLFQVMRASAKLKVSTVLAHLPLDDGPYGRNRIDVWWRGREHNGDLMLLLAHLLNVNPEWTGARVTLRTIVETEAERETMLSTLRQLLSEVNINAKPRVIVRDKSKTVLQIMREASKEADVVFCGLKLPESDEDAAYAEWLFKMASGFRNTIFVRNSSVYAGELI